MLTELKDAIESYEDQSEEAVSEPSEILSDFIPKPIKPKPHRDDAFL